MSNRALREFIGAIIFVVAVIGSYKTGCKEGNERAMKIAEACRAADLPIVMGEIKDISKDTAAGDLYCWMKVRFTPPVEWGLFSGTNINIRVDIPNNQKVLCNCRIGDKLPLQYDRGKQELAINFNNQVQIWTIQETP